MIERPTKVDIRLGPADLALVDRVMEVRKMLVQSNSDNWYLLDAEREVLTDLLIPYVREGIPVELSVEEYALLVWVRIRKSGDRDGLRQRCSEDAPLFR